MVIAVSYTHLLAEYLPRKRFYDHAFAALERLDKKYLLPELLESPDFSEGELCTELLRQAGKSMADEVAGYEVSMEEYRRYVETWIHEIKTPISAGEMLCRNHPGQNSRATVSYTHLDVYKRQISYLVKQFRRGSLAAPPFFYNYGCLLWQLFDWRDLIERYNANLFSFCHLCA